ncbi:hypothetical protein F4782DRAFT_525880 [Xylaria castorea]|nr:hypothetical protein F4782DRAFT_525880 [Xylaria castorea]
MQTRQTIALALMAFASIANCQMTPLGDDTECSQSLSTTAVATPSASSDAGGPLLTFSYVVSSTPAASSSVAPHSSSSSSPTIKTTSTTKAASSSAQATPTSSHAAVPSSSSSDAPATPTSTTKAATPSSGSSPGQGLSGTCSPNGMFNCVSGTQFQQCANGKWSVLAPLAGTKCTEGQSMTLWRRDEGSDKGTFQSRRRAN